MYFRDVIRRIAKGPVAVTAISSCCMASCVYMGWADVSDTIEGVLAFSGVVLVAIAGNSKNAQRVFSWHAGEQTFTA